MNLSQINIPFGEKNNPLLPGKKKSVSTNFLSHPSDFGQKQIFN